MTAAATQARKRKTELSERSLEGARKRREAGEEAEDEAPKRLPVTEARVERRVMPIAEGGGRVEAGGGGGIR